MGSGWKGGRLAGRGAAETAVPRTAAAAVVCGGSGSNCSSNCSSKGREGRDGGRGGPRTLLLLLLRKGRSVGVVWAATQPRGRRIGHPLLCSRLLLGKMCEWWTLPAATGSRNMTALKRGFGEGVRFGLAAALCVWGWEAPEGPPAEQPYFCLEVEVESADGAGGNRESDLRLCCSNGSGRHHLIIMII